MTFLPFQSLSVGTNLLIFAAAAAIIWFAGACLERYADAISRRTGWGRAFTGMLLLAAATSLPEVATTVTATLIGNPTLAVSNIIGGVVMQTAILAVADWRSRERGALSFFAPDFALLIQGVGLVILLQVVILGTTAEVWIAALGVGLWPILLVGLYLLILYLTYHYQDRPGWQPVLAGVDHADAGAGRSPLDVGGPASTAHHPEPRTDPPAEGRSLMQLFLLFAGCSLLVLAAGWVVAQVGDVLAVQTGLGSGLVGAVLVAIATSLPELSTTMAASQSGHYRLAFSNILGSNAFMIALLFVADLCYGGDAILRHAPRSALFLTALGTIVTCVYLWGLLERENRTVAGIGWDSAVVLLLYGVSLVALYYLR